MPVAPVLNSWKEIAAYMGRGVRTVQRWEQHLGLPVHRPQGKDRSAVVAMREELDHWLAKTPVRANGEGNGNGAGHINAA
jgi:phage terminase Nu1 subunit (DNA packaging protein)